MAKYVRRRDQEVNGLVQRIYSPEGMDWPLYRFEVDAYSGDMVEVAILRKDGPLRPWCEGTLIPRPLLDELAVVIAEAQGKLAPMPTREGA